MFIITLKDLNQWYYILDGNSETGAHMWSDYLIFLSHLFRLREVTKLIYKFQKIVETMVKGFKPMELILDGNSETGAHMWLLDLFKAFV